MREEVHTGGIGVYILYDRCRFYPLAIPCYKFIKTTYLKLAVPVMRMICLCKLKSTDPSLYLYMQLHMYVHAYNVQLLHLLMKHYKVYSVWKDMMYNTTE